MVRHVHSGAHRFLGQQGQGTVVLNRKAKASEAVRPVPLILFVAPLTLLACLPPVPDAPPSDAEIQDESATRLENAQRSATDIFVMPECTEEWAGKCGLWVDKLASNATIDHPKLGIEQESSDATQIDPAHSKLADIVHKLCEERFDRPVSEECKRRFGQMFTDAMTARYPLASDDRLLGWCAHHPDDCDPQNPNRLRTLELDFLIAHDRGVQANLAQTRQDVARNERQSTINAEKQRQAIADAERKRETIRQLMKGNGERAWDTSEGHPWQDVDVHPAK